jgi:hypothetical protein
MTESGAGDRATLRPDPPVPTVTHGFLFADLRGYTRYVDSHGDVPGAPSAIRQRVECRGATPSVPVRDRRSSRAASQGLFHPELLALRAPDGSAGFSAGTALAIRSSDACLRCSSW